MSSSSNSNMLQPKFETKSKRVKGLSFHRTRPWVLASLHNGCINMFDYRAQVLLDKYEDHDGPVRGVSFHETQPMFVSGGDDHKVKVWNYKTKKCQFTLNGHLDYVRTVQFHNELPWIVSSSDDQTIRVWNWQARGVIAILTGHSHYVMCAQFHPTEDLIASASLDTTIRVWDFSALREKSMTKKGSRPGELFGGTEIEVKHTLEGHEKGVNWVAFHPTMNILASAADDKTIKIWRLSGNKSWEMDTLKGHTNNVSCVLFHPRMDIVISNSEDRTLRYWDLNRRVQIHQVRKDTDRYWILAAHPLLNYFSAGFDNGMTVFKLEKERYASQRVGNFVFYVKAKNLYYYDLQTKNKAVMAPVTTNGKSVLLNQPSQIYYNMFNQSSHNILLQFDVEGGSFTVFDFDKDLKNPRCIFEKRGDSTLAAVFLSKDKICVLDSSRDVSVCNFDGSNQKKWPINKKGMGKIDNIFGGPLGKIIIKADDGIFMYDMSARKVISELQVNDVKQIQWATNFNTAVIITGTQIMIVNKNFQVLNQQKETSKIKSGCFNENNAYIYSTSTHIKYMFIENKTTGTFRSIDEPVYVSFFMKNQIFAVNRQGEMQVFEINNTDYMFKIALMKKNLQEVKEILGQGNLCGRSIISYLKEQGYSEIALFFESDLKQRFNLAIASGNTQVALQVAMEVKEKDMFLRLAQTAMSLGNYEITEKCYQMTRQFDKLNFFYAITGSTTKLNRMADVAGSLNEPMMKFNLGIYTSDVESRVRTLAEAGQLPLAYMTAKSHGLTDMVEALEQELEDSEEFDHIQIIDEADKYVSKAKVLLPLKPVFSADNPFPQSDWPMINMRAKEAEEAEKTFKSKQQMTNDNDMFFDANEFSSSNQQVSSILESSTKPAVEQQQEPEIALDDANWGNDEDEIDIDTGDLDIPVDNNDQTNAQDSVQDAHNDIFVPPSAGSDPLKQALAKNPLHAGLQVAQGEFVKAMELLKSQLGISELQELKQQFVDTYTLTKLNMQTLPHGAPLTFSLRSHGQTPILPINLQVVDARLQRGIEFTQKGNFEEALKSFKSCLQSIVLLAVDSKDDLKKLQGHITQVTEYIMAMRIELERKRLVTAKSEDQARIAELSCYMTLCGMNTAHKFLAFKNAMNMNYKMQNFVTAAHFARLICDLESTGIFASKPETINQYKKYYAAFQQKGSNAQKLNFNSQLNADLQNITGHFCAGDMVPLEDNRAIAVVKCPLDGSVFNKNSYTGKVCPVCNLCKLGEDVMGLNLQIEGSPADVNKAKQDDPLADLDLPESNAFQF